MAKQQPAPKRIDCVVVCVDYADFLAWTLPHNKFQFNRILVVTSKADEKTQKLCEYHHVECLATDVFYENGAKFNKAKGINAGLDRLQAPDWVCHMDADLLLPPLTRQMLEACPLDVQCLYSIDRMMCRDFVEFLQFWTEPPTQHENNVFVHLRPFPVGTRIAKQEHGGWVPIGFFQLWNHFSGQIRYPTEHTDAGRSDMQFSLQWPRHRRHLLPEIIGLHLETQSADGKMGANWFGRKTPRFGAEVLGGEDMTLAVPASDDSSAYGG